MRYLTKSSDPNGVRIFYFTDLFTRGEVNKRILGWILSSVLVLHSAASWAQSDYRFSSRNEYWLSRRVVDDRDIRGWIKKHQLTKQQATALNSTPFLRFNDNGGPWVDFTPDCSSEKTFLTRTSGVVSAIDYLQMSIANYPTALKEFGKWDAAAQQRMASLMQINDSVVAIANQSTSRAELLRKATPLLEKADKISGDLARSAGFWYHKDDGCGAGIEDSQRVSFSFSEKPRAAYYISQIDFDICKQASVNPDDPQKCDNWEQINAKGNPLSGNYRYLVVWLDGSVKEHSFKALSTGAKTIEITK